MNRRRIIDDDDDMDVDVVAHPVNPPQQTSKPTAAIAASTAPPEADIDEMALEEELSLSGEEDIEEDVSDEYMEDESRSEEVQQKMPKPPAKKKAKVDEVKSKLKFRNPNFSWQEAVGSRTRMIKWPRLAKMIKDEKMHEQPPNVATYVSIRAPPSLYPVKKYCDITGYEAKYRDPATGLRYKDATVYQFIKTNLTTPESVQQYLELRGAGTAIK
eukprot:TRINITY_DN4576_c0_g1_i1.p1 TRINITY_DN4576_c0_g1~~TRINITY_DN4576_c0_g1_i1.p1  ORF type:complete len:215 (+),score=47.35 TRINITY_DN4576_c0_g1_i1:194-838(+)